MKLKLSLAKKVGFEIHYGWFKAFLDHGFVRTFNGKFHYFIFFETVPKPVHHYHIKIYLLNRPIFQPPNIAQRLFSKRNLILISPFKRTMFENPSMLTFQDMKHSIEYLHIQCFYTPNFDSPEKFLNVLDLAISHFIWC